MCLILENVSGRDFCNSLVGKKSRSLEAHAETAQSRFWDMFSKMQQNDYVFCITNRIETS